MEEFRRPSASHRKQQSRNRFRAERDYCSANSQQIAINVDGSTMGCCTAAPATASQSGRHLVQCAESNWLSDLKLPREA